MCDLCPSTDKIDEVEDKQVCKNCWDYKTCYCDGCDERTFRDRYISGGYYCKKCVENARNCPRCNGLIYGPNPYCNSCLNQQIYCGDCDIYYFEGEECFCNMTYWEAKENVIGKTFDEIKSKRKFGIELEVGTCTRREELRATCWGAKQDGTAGVHTEFYTPILQGDEGLEEVRKFGRIAACEKGKNNGFQINNGCGFHLHVDCKSMKEEQLKRCAVALLITYKAWTYFVSKEREGNRYCIPDNTTVSTFESDKPFKTLIPRENDRYRWANWAAYHRHCTMENRLHTGSVDPIKIINWVKANIWLLDWAQNQDTNAIKDHFGMKIKNVEKKVPNNEYQCECAKHAALNGFSTIIEKVEVPPTVEQMFVGLAKIWNEKDGGELTSFYLGRIKKHLVGSDRKFDFEKVAEELKIIIPKSKRPVKAPVHF